jgi:hypothetical protein
MLENEYELEPIEKLDNLNREMNTRRVKFSVILFLVIMALFGCNQNKYKKPSKVCDEYRQFIEFQLLE